jgi:hypothetical protein
MEIGGIDPKILPMMVKLMYMEKLSKEATLCDVFNMYDLAIILELSDKYIKKIKYHMSQSLSSHYEYHIITFDEFIDYCERYPFLKDSCKETLIDVCSNIKKVIDNYVDIVCKDRLDLYKRYSEYYIKDANKNSINPLISYPNF